MSTIPQDMCFSCKEDTGQLFCGECGCWYCDDCVLAHDNEHGCELLDIYDIRNSKYYSYWAEEGTEVSGRVETTVVQSLRPHCEFSWSTPDLDNFLISRESTTTKGGL